jgi:iron complex outermembrane receptor protein
MARYINPYTDFEFKKIFVFIAFIQIFLVEYSPFSAQELKKSNLILVAEFSPTEGEANLSMGQELQSEFLRKISNSGFQAQKSTRATLSSRLEEARSLNALYLVEGNYERSSLTSNLNLYLQIFDPDSGQLVDAYSLNDDVYSIEGLKLDPNELKEDDKIRIQKFSTKGTLNIKTNPTKKERRDNIDQYIAGTKFGSKFKPYIRSEEKASVEALENVFDLLKGQITTSTTKTAKKTNEAPNIVSVITDKQIHDFGRISINDILYQLPGFAPGQINERRTVSSRGLYEGWNNNHLLMLVDGVQQNELFYGSALTWEITPLNMIKSLEVIRGPGSALYGSNATNGVISINTYSGSDLKGRMAARARVGD